MGRHTHSLQLRLVQEQIIKVRNKMGLSQSCQKGTVGVDANNQDLLKVDLQTVHQVSDTKGENTHKLLLSTSARRQ